MAALLPQNKGRKKGPYKRRKKGSQKCYQSRPYNIWWWEYLLYEHVVGMIFAGESDPVHWTSIPIVCPHLPATRLTDSLGKFLPLAQVRQPRWAGSSTHFRFLFAGLGSWDGRKSSKSRRECLFTPRTCSNASLLVLQRIESAILTTQKDAQILKDKDLSDGKQTLTLSLTYKYIDFHNIFVLRWISCSLFVEESLFRLYMEDMLLYWSQTFTCILCR